MSIKITDLTTTPEFGTAVTHGGVEAAFIPNTPALAGCHSCVFKPHCSERNGTYHVPCSMGVYVAKDDYLAMKLLGEIV